MSDKLETERETAFHSKWLHQATVHRLYKPDGQGGRVCVGVVELAPEVTAAELVGLNLSGLAGQEAQAAGGKG